jgi:DinB superfamily
MTASLPPDLQAIHDALDDAERHAERLVGDLSDAQLNWQPDGGTRWSVAQCIDHLSKTNAGYSRAIADAIRRHCGGGSYRPIRPGWVARCFLSVLEPPVRLRVPTIRTLLPGSAFDAAALVRKFAASHDPVREAVYACAELDPNATRYQYPFLARMNFTVGSGLLIINAHDRRHLWQAERVRARSDFPRT